MIAYLIGAKRELLRADMSDIFDAGEFGAVQQAASSGPRMPMRSEAELMPTVQIGPARVNTGATRQVDPSSGSVSVSGAGCVTEAGRLIAELSDAPGGVAIGIVATANRCNGRLCVHRETLPRDAGIDSVRGFNPVEPSEEVRGLSGTSVPRGSASVGEDHVLTLPLQPGANPPRLTVFHKVLVAVGCFVTAVILIQIVRRGTSDTPKPTPHHEPSDPAILPAQSTTDQPKSIGKPEIQPSIPDNLMPTTEPTTAPPDLFGPDGRPLPITPPPE